MLSRLWGRITGADKKLQRPNQQASFLGRVGNHTIVFPYGLYADLPAEALLKAIDAGAALPVTVERPPDTAQAEPVFFHPATNTRIIARNNGDLDIFTDDAGGDVNITTVNANVVASENVDIQCIEATVAASTSATIDTPVTTMTGNATVQGILTVVGAAVLGAVVTSGGQDISGTHTHAHGDPTTGPPNS